MKTIFAVLLLTGCTQGNSVETVVSKDFTHRIEDMKGGVCSATAIGQRSLLTASHCLAEDQKILVVDGTAVGILHIERDKSDHAIVVVTNTFKAVASVGVTPKQGDRVHWYGQPMGLEQIYGEGVVVGNKDTRYLIDGQIWFGVSGAGLMNERGEVVGVASGILGQQIYKLGFAWPLAFTAAQWAAVQ
ncbi:S1 family peptidase [Pseudoxanthomonas sacheonensis]|uniref:S1 family peptidase n=1 Tax=Pseudoxanthomonas sacheonensis TaxID=443615 RepID=UPI0013D2FC08|nr:serine protease [Pseudoxanthomonas sacheonensis]KAF1706274.1 hypothetical protein CSC73_16350 [Pseudoxanthomonas sacheonensis]